jgi:hypothetical protein
MIGNFASAFSSSKQSLAFSLKEPPTKAMPDLPREIYHPYYMYMGIEGHSKSQNGANWRPFIQF